MELTVCFASKNVIMPAKATAGSACFDLLAAENTSLDSWASGSISTGLKLKIPNDFFGKIYSRSGQFLRERLTVEAGIIDPDFRGVLKVLMFNHSSNVYSVKVGQRIAQICFFKKVYINFCSVDSFEPEPQNERGECGFGSSGDF